MKLITLNTWGARVKKPFEEFIKNNQETDIFCFQEIYEKSEEKLSARYPEANHNLFTELKELLSEHNAFFRPAFVDVYGVAIFVKKSISVLEEGDIVIHESDSPFVEAIEGNHPRNMQWVKISTGNGAYTIMNVHGLWNGKGKTDSPERITQSNRIKEFVRSVDGPKILCGDFNLRPDTESIKILGEGMRDLIKEHGIKSTRTSFYNKPEKYADYVFVSSEINVEKFEVMDDEVSDHAPLLLELKF